MSARYETPLFVDAKIEELTFEEKNIKFISFVQSKAKMHCNKIRALVTTSPQEQFFNPTPILTHSCILIETSQRFSSKKTRQISNLNKSLIAGNHVCLPSRSAFTWNKPNNIEKYNVHGVLCIKQNGEACIKSTCYYGKS